MKKVLLVLLFSIILNANELLTPKSGGTFFDFTAQKDVNLTYKDYEIINKEIIEIESLIGFIPRYFKTNTCGTDTYGNTYCEEALAECAQEWDYDRGYSVAKQSIRYANKYLVTRSYVDTQSNATQEQTVYIKHAGCCSTHAGTLGNTPPCNVAPACRVLGPSGDVFSGCYADNGITYPWGRYYNAECPGGTVWKCPGGWTNNNNGTCSITRYYDVLVCPGGYADNGSNCSQAYTYYEYKCKNELNSQEQNWQIINAGGTSSYSATPPVNNCKRLKFTCVADRNRPCAKVNNKWQCSAFACNNSQECGYATCNGLSTSNTAIMPYEYHPIEALTRSGNACIPIQCSAEYEYSNGTSTKVTKNYCQGTVIGGKCMVSGVQVAFKTYYYHTYSCDTSKNSFGNSWQLLANNTDPGCIDDTFGNCINFEPLTSQCRRQIHTCPNGTGTCTLNSNNKYTCSYDGCDSVRYPCIGQMCDLALNDQISFCVEESCPSYAGVIKENGKCYYETCPNGSVENSDGKCEVLP